MADPLQESGVFPAMVCQMISVGEETGSIDDLLVQAAGFYEEEVDYELKGLTDALEPILIVLVAVMVGFVAISILMAVFNLTNGMNA